MILSICDATNTFVDCRIILPLHKKGLIHNYQKLYTASKYISMSTKTTSLVKPIDRLLIK